MVHATSLGFPLCPNAYEAFDCFEKNSFSWANDHRILENPSSRKAYSVLNSGRFGHYTYWYSDTEKTQLGTDLIGWLFMWDDVYPDGQFRREPQKQFDTNHIYLKVYETGYAALHNSPFSHSLVDLKNRFAKYADNDWLSRFQLTLRDYFNGCLKEVLFRTANVIPTFEQYKDFRHQSVGAYPVLDFMEIAQSSFLTSAMYDSSLFQDFRKTSSWILALTNDYFSLFKEELELDSFNSVIAIQNEFKIDKNEAIDFFVKEHAKEVSKMLALEEEIKIKWGVNSPAAKYCFAARAWMQGNLDWSLQTPRYQASLLMQQSNERN